MSTSKDRAKFDDLEPYCDRALAAGFAHALPVHPSTVITAPWVRMKCRYGCGGYGWSHCCPPDTPTPEETRKVLDSYRRAILFHIEAPKIPGRGRRFDKLYEFLVDLEGAVFKDGFYKAFVYLAGPCKLCRECAKMKGTPCNFASQARPSMEACGIDVFQTARNNEFSIRTLKEKSETQNVFCLLLVN